MLRKLIENVKTINFRRCSSFVNDYTYRTHTCGELRLADEGKDVKLCGWLEYCRPPKFLVIRDSYGSTQVYNGLKELKELIKSLNTESVLQIEGRVSARPAKDRNPKMPTGDIEIDLKKMTVLNEAMDHSMPINVHDWTAPSNDAVRFQYRYLDIRRKYMQNILRFRAQLISKMRKFLGK